MRWFRFYDEALDDPKVQRLPAELFKAWVNLLCVASRNKGIIPADIERLAFSMRTTATKLEAQIATLKDAGLLDEEDGLRPHNWSGRQYASDDVATRVKRFRERKGNDTTNVACNVTETTNETPPDTEQNRTEQKDAIAPQDRLWKTGVPYLRDRGGKSESQARSVIGKWLKSNNVDDVLAAFSRAQAERVVEPVAFIAACLKPLPPPKAIPDVPGFRPMGPGGG
jgi:hypothetical protein